MSRLKLRSCFVAVLFGVCAVVSIAPPVAQSAFPGRNGKIAFFSTGFYPGGGVETINSDGSGRQPLTSGIDLEWSPDGSRIAFSRGSPGLFIANADGTGERRIVPGAGNGSPTWSPDGTKLAFIKTGGCSTSDCANNELWTVNADGTNPAPLVQSVAMNPHNAHWSPDGAWIAFKNSENGVFVPYDDGMYVIRPDGSETRSLTRNPARDYEIPLSWSPDSSRILFAFSDDPARPSAPARGLGTIKPDGTGMLPLPFWTAGYWALGASYSPDGSKIVVSHAPGDPTCSSACTTDLIVMNADGSSQVNITNTPTGEVDPDWQAIPTPPPGFPRPKGATPFQTYFTVAYEPCPSGTGNRQHGPPLSVLSCSPAVQSSSFLTVGTLDSNQNPAKLVGRIRLDVVQGDPATPVDEADVKISIATKDIRNKPDLSDYTGELSAVSLWQITDRFNGPIGALGGSEAGTTTAFPLPVTAPCVPTADLTIGSTCNVETSADAVVNDFIKEGKRMLTEIRQIQVYDGGADGIANTTDDNTLFMDEGIFVP